MLSHRNELFLHASSVSTEVVVKSVDKLEFDWPSIPVGLDPNTVRLR
jgi:hypothetical protein